MSAPGARTRRGRRLPTGRASLFPAAGIVVGVALLSTTIGRAGQDSSSSNTAGVITATSATDPAGVLAGVPAGVPAGDSCSLVLDGTPRSLSVSQARTLTQIAAVGWQVKAPEDMVARVLDIAGTTPATAPTVTETLDLFTREDSAAPTAEAVADLRAVTVPGSLTCVFAPPAATAQKKGPSGLTPRADALRQGVIDAFGELPMTGFGKKATPETTAQSAGRAIGVQVPVPPAFARGGEGWMIAHWLAARGGDFTLDTIAFGERTWAPTQGWVTVTPGTAAAAQARADRVYVAVAQGATPKASPAKKPKKDTKKTSRERS